MEIVDSGESVRSRRIPQTALVAVEVRCGMYEVFPDGLGFGGPVLLVE